jgi:energy-coupling factor transporter ATP-binding protein EcfA2
MTRLQLENLGQIKSADIEFGDLTLFVGPQASGKSIILQLIKLLLDSKSILQTIDENGYDWQNGDDNWQQQQTNFIEFYFGGGMGSLWQEGTNISFAQKTIQLDQLLQIKKPYPEKLFFVPAQRVLAIDNGWPRAFTNFEIGDPYVIRYFSERLRVLMQRHLRGKDSAIFPQKGVLGKALRKTIDSSIFHGDRVELNTTEMRKRIQLNMNGDQLSFMAWSTGQREFIPLLLGLYWLMPVSTTSQKPDKRLDIDWVVIEEPEMGLHPQAILSVIFICLDLLNRGYRLIISTHSPTLLEAVWAIQVLKENNLGAQYLFQLFDLPVSQLTESLFENILENKRTSIYYFDRQNDGITVKDISSLDPFESDPNIAEWGGLTSFSSRASEVISQAIQENT